eukprot:TRINITY_DN23143_c0_g1_i1.p1 TRINITY_DN23143_c0_g1~~TRINITY_DN23143_c0_g1_i1.p1  ORF type:complete len:606 (+),score=123.12 TRINITY_DN23143_c0_g1_i1:123-1940(+)
MLRLPSAALAWNRPSVGDFPVSPCTSEAEWIEDPPSPSSPSSAAFTEKRRSTKVLRSRFCLDHESSAQLHDIYEVEDRPLGTGGFGAVYRARFRTGGDVIRAVKKLPKLDASKLAAARKEAAILKRLDHPYLCRLLETYEGRSSVYLVMELAEGQELFFYIHERMKVNQSLDERDGAEIMSCVFEALNYCHGQGVLHRDMKPENIMVRSGSSESSPEVKIIDFGLATFSRREEKRPNAGASLVGTYSYMAPEVRLDSKHSRAADMWATGMVLHALFLGGLPDAEVQLGEMELDLQDEAYTDISRKAKFLLGALIQARPENRLTAGEAGRRCMEIVQQRRASTDSLVTVQESGQTMRSLLSFHRSNMLRRAVLTALAMQIASQKMIASKQQFLEADGNGDGKLSREELASSISNMPSGDVSDQLSGDIMAWVESVFDSVDTDGSDSIEYTEWIAAALREGSLRCEEAVQAAFRVFDADHNGKISLGEFSLVLADTPAEIAKLLPAHDLNGDGEIDMDEFRQVITGSPEVFGGLDEEITALGFEDQSADTSAASTGDIVTGPGILPRSRSKEVSKKSTGTGSSLVRATSSGITYVKSVLHRMVPTVR